MTPEQRALLEDKADLWRRSSKEGNMELRSYNGRCADALDALLNERDDLATRLPQLQAIREALEAVEQARHTDAESDWSRATRLTDAALALPVPDGKGADDD